MLKQTSTPILGNFWQALRTSVGYIGPQLECDGNYSPPVAVSLLMTPDLLPMMHLRAVRNIEFVWEGNYYCDMDTMRYA